MFPKIQKLSKKGSPAPPTVVNNKELPDVKFMTESNKQFSEKCTKLLRAGIPGNFIYSPFYLRILIGMSKVGARGKTGEEIQNSFNFPSNDSIFSNGIRKILTSVGTNWTEASRFFIESGFQVTTTFALELLHLYKQEIQSIDFSDPIMAATIINSWFGKFTKNHIQLVINPKTLNQYTRLLLINAIYLNTNWKDKFERRVTKKGTFHLTQKKSIEIDMMMKKGRYMYTDLSHMDSQAISLPYHNEQLNLIIILPKTIGPLSRLNKKEIFPSDIFDKMVEHTIEMILPKFKIESTIHFIQPIKMLGIKTMFDPTSADFSGITGYPIDDLYMSEIIQKVVFECNENDGTTNANALAVAATNAKKKGGSSSKTGDGAHVRSSVSISGHRGTIGSGGGGKLIHFHADHPFLFILIDKLSKIVLFYGACVNPTIN